MKHSKPGVIEAGRKWMRFEMSNTEYWSVVRAANRPPRKARKPLREALARLLHPTPDRPEPDVNCTCGRPSCIMCDRDQ